MKGVSVCVCMFVCIRTWVCASICECVGVCEWMLQDMTVYIGLVPSTVLGGGLVAGSSTVVDGVVPSTVVDGVGVINKPAIVRKRKVHLRMKHIPTCDKWPHNTHCSNLCTYWAVLTSAYQTYIHGVIASPWRHLLSTVNQP